MIGLKAKSRKKIQKEEKTQGKERQRRDKENQSRGRRKELYIPGQGLVEMP
jgi:hypothetical protein